MVKLSEKEVQKIEEKIKEGFFYAAKDEISFGIVGLFREKPERVKLSLESGGSNVFYSESSKPEATLDEFYHKFVTYENSPVYLPEVVEKQKEMRGENMDAVEFLKKFKEICNSENCKGKCPFDDEEQGCSFHTDSVEVIMEKVKKLDGKRNKSRLTDEQKAIIKNLIKDEYFYYRAPSIDGYAGFYSCIPSKFAIPTRQMTTAIYLYDFLMMYVNEDLYVYLPDLLKEE